MSDIKSYFAEKQQAMIDMLTELVTIESPSHVKAAVDQMSTRVAELFAENGATIEHHPRETVGDIVLGKWNADASGKPILILAHMDTVHTIGTTIERPVKLDAEGRLYGPGTIDMKGGLVVALTAIQGLVERDELPNSPIWFLATSDEEIGSLRSRELIEDLAKQSGLVLVLEPPTRDGAMKTSRKGTASYEMIIKGKAAHAGNEPEAGINAVIEFSQQAIDLNQLNDIRNGTSVSVTTVSGGTATNVIPALVTARLDVRAPTQKAYDSVHEKIMARSPFMPGAEVEIKRIHVRPPMERNGELFEQVKLLAKAEGITIREDGAGGGSDGNFTAALGIPTLDGLGPEGTGLHAPNEHVLVKTLPKKAALVAIIIRDWEF
jgi:glutamate carboxypeptidase